MLAKLRRTSTSLLMDGREYAANISGLQIVFGAVLGFVLAGAEAFDPVDFAVLLLTTFTGVVSILYISASRHRLLYTALAITLSLSLPWVVEQITDVAAPEKLAPTLLIWTLFQAAVEFMPRRKPATDADRK